MKIKPEIGDDEAVQLQQKLIELEVERLQNLSLLSDEHEKKKIPGDNLRKGSKKLKKEKRKSLKDGRISKKKSCETVSNNSETIIKIEIKRENSPSNLLNDELQTSNNQGQTNKRKSKKNQNFVDTISRNRIELALKLLENDGTKKKTLSPIERRLADFKKYCNLPNLNVTYPEYMWESGSFIIKNIRSCILTRDWQNLTHMLLFLLPHNRKHFVKQVVKLNFMKNPADIGEECLQEFLQYFDKSSNDLIFDIE